MAGGMHGRGHVHVWQGDAWQGAGVVHGRGYVWQGGMHGRGHDRGMCVARGCAWQKKWPFQWTVLILLECIPV